MFFAILSAMISKGDHPEVSEILNGYEIATLG